MDRLTNLDTGLKSCGSGRPWPFGNLFAVDLNKKSLPKQKTIQNFTIDAQGFRKTRNENLSRWK